MSNDADKNVIRLTPQVMEQLKSYAEAHGVSVDAMVNRFLYQATNAGRRLIEDEFAQGKPSDPR